MGTAFARHVPRSGLPSGYMHMWLQPSAPTVAAGVPMVAAFCTYGCSWCTYGCSLLHLWLQRRGHMLTLLEGLESLGLEPQAPSA